MKKIGSIAIIVVILFASAFAVTSPTGKKDIVKDTKGAASITWNKYDDGVKLAAKSKKPMMIDFFTNWCGFCKKMDQQTYIDPTIIKYVNDHFIAVKLNAESKEALNLPDGQSNGTNIARSFGVRSYPQTWFVEANGSKLGGRPGYMPPQVFIYFLKYYGEGHYKQSTFEEYYKQTTSTKQ
jgi:thioredoxin-related protein